MDVSTPEELGFSSARVRRIDAYMRALIDQGKIAGGVTLIARHGKLAHLAAQGLRDVEAGKPMQPDTIFRIASMAKPIVAAATLMLYEEGRFLLEDPVADFIPEFAETKVFVRETADGTDGGMELADLERPISIRHLLTHTSGLTHGDPSGTPVERIYAQEQFFREDETLEVEIPRLARVPLAHQPGSAWTYGASFDVLGRLIELVSGQAFDTFLKERIFDPLEMSDTGFYVPDQHLDRLAAVYTPAKSGGLRRDEGAEQLGARPVAFLSGGGGLVSTALDYARFGQMLLGGGELDGKRLLGRKTVELLLANHLAGSQAALLPTSNPFFAALLAGQGFALGGMVTKDVGLFGTPRSIGSYGWGGAATTHFWVDPREDLVGVILLQLTPIDLGLQKLLEALAYQALVG